MRVTMKERMEYKPDGVTLDVCTVTIKAVSRRRIMLRT